MSGDLKIRICSKPTKEGYLCGNPLDDNKKCKRKHGKEFNEECLKAWRVSFPDD